MEKRIKIILFIVLIILMWLPFFQESTKLFHEPELFGAFEKPDKPNISAAEWKTGEYQKNLENYKNYNFGFRGFFVKIVNTINYFLFKKINPEDQIEGKQGYIYSQSSIDRYYG